MNRKPELIVCVGTAPKDKEAAIRDACRRLAEAGCVDERYAESMLKREQTANTFLGAGIAIPHGDLADKGRVKRDGLAVLQVPRSVPWGNAQNARLIVAIAAAGDGHLAMLRRLTGIVQDEALVEKLCATADAAEIKAALLSDKLDAAPAAAPATDFSVVAEWTVDYPAGLHARPALAWTEFAKATKTPLKVRRGDAVANPRQLVSLLHLGVKFGEKLVVSADGDRAALTEFIAQIASLTARERADSARTAVKKKNVAAQPAWTPPDATESFSGVAASPGLAVGEIFHFDAVEIKVADQPGSLEKSGAELEAAINQAKAQLTALVDKATRQIGAGDAAIFKAHIGVLTDPEVIAECCRHLVAGHGAAWSWHRAIEFVASSLEHADNPLLAARAADIRDAGRRVLTVLEPDLAAAAPVLPDRPVILVARDLSPSATAGLDARRVSALALAAGSATSHTAILARTLGIPAVVAAGRDWLRAPNGETVIIDGDAGWLYRRPSAVAITAAREEIARRESVRAERATRRALPAVTSDGKKIIAAANINTPDQAPLALEMGAEGVGLMRTEFLFLERADIPDENEQFITYCQMANALGGRPLIVRALDIGGDKQVPQLHLPREDNPFLGVRGARLLLRRPDLFAPQMRALYRAAASGAALSVMFPMITDLAELTELRERCEHIRRELAAPAVPLGIMIEVPAAAVLAATFAETADFFSIGTNDLTQYTLSMDRQNPELAASADSFHPAVLRLIKQTVDGAAARKRPVGVCGGLAGTPSGAAILAGLGVSELSMTPRDLPEVKEVIRSRPMTEFVALAHRCLAATAPEQVREWAGECVKSR
ncbi:multiphosphoryl transfer protein [Planctomycetales bacterium]|nr:multiphosphoryl transfer protein [Planctomycetales bacterium]